MHWRSDVDASGVIGAATVARLQSNETFRAQLALAREEIVQAQAKGMKPGADCAAQAAALNVEGRATCYGVGGMAICHAGVLSLLC